MEPFTFRFLLPFAFSNKQKKRKIATLVETRGISRPLRKSKTTKDQMQSNKKALENICFFLFQLETTFAFIFIMDFPIRVKISPAAH